MVRLELLEKKDLNQIVKWFESKPVDFLVQWAGPTYQYPLTVQQMEEHYRNGFIMPDSDTYLYKIVQTDSDEMVGSIQLCKINYINKSAVVGRFIIGVESLRGKGFGELALKELARIAFQKFDLCKLKIVVYDTNVNAIRCYEKVGFSKEKYTKDVYEADNGLWGMYDMYLYKETWQEKK